METVAGLSGKSVPVPLYKFLFPKIVALGEVKLGLQRHLFHLKSAVSTTMVHSSRGAHLAQVIVPCYRCRGWPISLESPVTLGHLPNLQGLQICSEGYAASDLKLSIGATLYKPFEWSCHLCKCQRFIPSSHTYVPVHATSESLHVSGTDNLSEGRSLVLQGRRPRVARSTLNGPIY